MSDTVEENKYFLALLAQVKNRKQFEELLKLTDKQQVTAISIVLFNIGQGDVDKSDELLKLLDKKSTKRIIKALHSKRKSVVNKRKILLAYKSVIFKILKLACKKLISVLF